MERGDSLSFIAKQYRVSVIDIKKINGLKSDRILVGQRLWIPWKGIWHTVREGENLDLIGKALKVEIPKKNPSPPAGVWHTIKQNGKNIFRIALNYGEDRSVNWKEMQNEIMRHSRKLPLATSLN